MACFGFVTFFPLRPDFSLPCFMARISRSTSWPAEGEYLRPEDFFELDLLELDFFEAEPRVLFFAALPRVLFLALLPRVLFLVLLRRVLFFALLLRVPREERDDPLFERLLDFFLAAFLVAITILLGGQMGADWGKLHPRFSRRLPHDRQASAFLVTRRVECQGYARVDRRLAMW